MSAMTSPKRLTNRPIRDYGLSSQDFILGSPRSHRVRALKIERARNVPLASHGLGKGDVVRHAKWGEGEIVRVQGETVGAFFPGIGEKLLKASFLEKVEP